MELDPSAAVVEQLRKNRPVDAADAAAAKAAVSTQVQKAPAEEFSREFAELQLNSLKVQVKLQEEELRRVKQQFDQRRWFFKWAVISISIVLGLSAAFMIWYFIVRGDKIEATVMAAWLASGLVETLGLGYIIANYLFDGRGANTGRSTNAKGAPPGD